MQRIKGPILAANLNRRVGGATDRPLRSQGRIFMAKVAFLGLGVMGYPMAGHLKVKGGHDVTVYNRTAAKAEKWVAQFGGRSAPTPRAAAEGQDFVMACVGNDHDLREVALGADGAFHGVAGGAVFVDHTTASAEIARELHAAARKGGFDAVDAPVSRSEEHTSELQSLAYLVCRLLLEKKKIIIIHTQLYKKKKKKNNTL